MHLQSAMATMKTDWKGNEKVQKRAGGKNFWQPLFAWEALTLSAVIKTIFWIRCLFLRTDVRKKPVSNLYKTRKHQYLIFNSHDTVFGLEQRFFRRCYQVLVDILISTNVLSDMHRSIDTWIFFRLTNFGINFPPKIPASVGPKSTVTSRMTRSIFDEVIDRLIKWTTLVDSDVGWLSQSSILVQTGISQKQWLKSPWNFLQMFMVHIGYNNILLETMKNKILCELTWDYGR